MEVLLVAAEAVDHNVGLHSSSLMDERIWKASSSILSDSGRWQMIQNNVVTSNKIDSEISSSYFLTGTQTAMRVQMRSRSVHGGNSFFRVGDWKMQVFALKLKTSCGLLAITCTAAIICVNQTVGADFQAWLNDDGGEYVQNLAALY